jgi:hypothetical protein
MVDGLQFGIKHNYNGFRVHHAIHRLKDLACAASYSIYIQEKTADGPKEGN